MGWIKLKEIGMKETGILVSCSDYHIFMNKLKRNKKTISEININNFKKVKNWEKENKKAIDSYNQRVKENGLFSNGLRQF